MAREDWNELQGPIIAVSQNQQTPSSEMAWAFDKPGILMLVHDKVYSQDEAFWKEKPAQLQVFSGTEVCHVTQDDFNGLKNRGWTELEQD